MKHLTVVLVALAGMPGWLGLRPRKALPDRAGASSHGSSVTNEQKAPAIAARTRAGQAYGKLPLRFEPNEGKGGGQGEFLSRGRGYTLLLTSSQAVLALKKSGQASDGAETLRMQFLAANSSATATAMEQLPGAVNYFIGNDPRKWRTNVRTYRKVKYRDIYAGVDLFYYGNQQQLEYDIVVNPGADPAAARLGFSGASRIQLDSAGDLVVQVSGGTVRLRKPVAYQQTADGRRPIDAHYALRGEDQVAFAVGSYDRSKALVIDPVLVYSSYLGGAATEVINSAAAPGGYFSGIAVDAAGSVYVIGSTVSTDFPTVNPFQPASGGGDSDAFVTKFTPDGSALVYSTYLGGSGVDYGGGIAVDSSGNAYITGETASADFPTTHGAFMANRPTGGFNPSAFVAKLNGSGSALVYSTYLGGSASDWATGIAVDSAGRASVTGQANSANFPVTKGAPQTTRSGAPDAFVATMTADGTSLVFSTYLGGKLEDSGNGIALDSSGNIYVAGMTASSNFPTVNPLQPALAGSWNVFVAKLNPDTATLIYSTFLGGSAFDEGQGIAVDSSGSAYITGKTSSIDFPTASPFQAALPGPAFTTTGVFLSKLNPAGSALIYSTYLGGGSPADLGLGIAVDSIGAAYITGLANSGNIPAVNALQPYKGNAPFVAKFTPDGSTLAYSTFFASGGIGSAIAVDASNSAYVTGTTESPVFVTTSGAEQTVLGSVEDAFVVKISGDKTVTSATASPGATVFGEPTTFTATVTAGVVTSNIPTGTVSFELGAATLGTASLSSGTAIFETSALSPGNHTITASYSGDAYFAGSAATFTEVVRPAATTTALISSPGPSAVGLTVTFTATVAPVTPGAGSPTGTVTFTDGTTSLGTAQVTSGVAPLGVSTLTAGTHTIIASYGGDPDFVASASTGLTQIVAPSAVPIVDMESVTVTDAPSLAAVAAVVGILDSESVTVTDAPSVGAVAAVVGILDSETVTVTDAPNVGYSPCDFQHNSRFTIADVQLAINQALGVAPPVNDLNGDGWVNIADIQAEIIAALGLGCIAQ
jgi:hypothetical protein